MYNRECPGIGIIVCWSIILIVKYGYPWGNGN